LKSLVKHTFLLIVAWLDLYGIPCQLLFIFNHLMGWLICLVLG